MNIKYWIYYAVKVEFVVTCIHNDCNEKGRFIRWLTLTYYTPPVLVGLYLLVITATAKVGSIFCSSSGYMTYYAASMEVGFVVTTATI